MSDNNNRGILSQLIPQIQPRSSSPANLQRFEAQINELTSRCQKLESENLNYQNICQDLQNKLLNATLNTNTVNDAYETQSICAINDTYVDVGVTNVCSDIETILQEANDKLVDESTVKPVFENLVNRLWNLIMLQYSCKNLKQLNELKEELILKLNKIDQTIHKNAQRVNELEKQNEKVMIEYNALKATFDCKNMIDNGQLSLLNEEFVSWKNEMKTLNTKILEQNSIIHKLVEKCSVMDKSIAAADDVNTNGNATEKLPIDLNVDSGSISKTIIYGPLIDSKKSDGNINGASSNTNTNQQPLQPPQIPPPPIPPPPIPSQQQQQQQQQQHEDDSFVSPGTSPNDSFQQNIRRFINSKVYEDKNLNRDPDPNEFSSFEVFDNDFNTMRTPQSAGSHNSNRASNNSNNVSALTTTTAVHIDTTNTNTNGNNKPQILLPTTDDPYFTLNSHSSTDSNLNNDRNTLSTNQQQSNSNLNTYYNNDDTEKSLKLYQCPICQIQVSNDIDFTLFHEHVTKCDGRKLTCLFCLKFFDKNDQATYAEHIETHLS